MPWFKLDDQAAFHAKVLAAGNEAYGVWCRAGAWSSGALRDGFVPLAVAKTIGPPRTWRRLVEVRLCEDTEGGYSIHDFLDWNPSSEVVRRERESKTELRREAGRLGGVHSGLSRRSKQGSKTEANDEAKPKQTPKQTGKQTPKQNEAPSPSPSPIPEDLNSQVDPRSLTPGSLGGDPDPGVAERPRLTRFEETFWREAYSETVREVTGNPWGFPAKQLPELQCAIEAHCKKLNDIDGWLRSKVAEFVRETRTKAGIWSSFGPTGFLRWLNAGCPKESGEGSRSRSTGQREPVPLKELPDLPDPPDRRPQRPQVASGPPAAPSVASEPRSPPPGSNTAVGPEAGNRP